MSMFRRRLMAGQMSGEAGITALGKGFLINYNAKQYNAATHAMPYTPGALVTIPAVVEGGGYSHQGDFVNISGQQDAYVSFPGYQSLFSRSDDDPAMTIVAKAQPRTTDYDAVFFGNAVEKTEDQYRLIWTSYYAELTGKWENTNIETDDHFANVISVRVDADRQIVYNNYTTNDSYTHEGPFEYKAKPAGIPILFKRYVGDDEFLWAGDFYWIYVAAKRLSDAEVQTVIDYNEGL